MFHWITQSNKLLLTSILAFTIFVMVFNPSSFVGSEIEYSGSEIPETNYEADLQVKDENTPNEFLMKPTSRNDVRPTVNLPPTPSIWCPASASTITPVLMDASNSTDPDGSIDEYWWSFGDGIEYIESSLIAPDGSFDGITYHEYKDDGHYNITLNITDNGSSISSVFTSIDIINRPPVPQFTAPDTLFSRETLYLDGSGSFDLDGQVINHTWIIDGIIYSYRSLELINFTKLGSHEIKLMVRDDDGIEAWNMHEIKVSNRLPIARGWYHRNSVYYNGTIEFNATQSIDYGGTIVSYKWDLGDGTIKSGKIVTHKFLNSGVYNVNLTVTDDLGGTDTDTLTILVENLPPVADAGSDISTLAGQPTIFSAYRSFDSDGSVNEYIWDFGDGSISRGISVNHIYSSPGIYKVTLSVIDNMGTMGVDTLNLTVINKAPVPDFSVVPEVPLPGGKVIFNAEDSTDQDGHIVSYQWDFDSVNVSKKSGIEVQHVFSKAGNYTVTLSIEDEIGEKVDLSRIIRVGNIAPEAVAGPDIVVIQGTKVHFNASGTQGQGDIAKYEWAFEDRNKKPVLLTGISPSYTFLDTGEFSVLLKVTDEGGIWSTDTLIVSVRFYVGFHLLEAIPGPGESDVRPDTNIKLRFSEKVKDTLVDVHIRLKGEGNSTCSVIINISADGKEIFLRPTLPLHFNTKYFILISQGLTDIYNNTMVSEMNLSFTVISPFEVSSHTVDNTTGFDPKASIVIEFNRPVETVELTGLLRLLGPDMKELDISIINVLGGLNITVVPAVQLDFDSSYTLVIDQNAKCLKGGPMEEEYRLQFTTRSAFSEELASSGKDEAPTWMYYLLVSILIVIAVLALYFLVIKRKGTSPGEILGTLSFKKGNMDDRNEQADQRRRERRRERGRSSGDYGSRRESYGRDVHPEREGSSGRDREDSRRDTYHEDRRRRRNPDRDDEEMRRRGRGGEPGRRQQERWKGERKTTRERHEADRFSPPRDDYQSPPRGRYTRDYHEPYRYNEFEKDDYSPDSDYKRIDDFYYFKEEKSRDDEYYYEEDEGGNDDYYYEDDEGGDDDYYYEDDEGGDDDYYYEDDEGGEDGDYYDDYDDDDYYY